MGAIQIKRLQACSLEEATEAWNKGFEGYYFDATSTVDQFITRMGAEGLSPALSVVAFADGAPVGLVLSGVRTIAGKKVAWNGGTGVATAYRRQGIGKVLMSAALDAYQEAGVEIATLEAFRQNERAIELYKLMGYDITDRLLFLQRTDALDTETIFGALASDLSVEHARPQDVRHLPYYQHMAPWQTQWNGPRDGEAVLVRDAAGEIAGYALYKRGFDETGELLSISLLQCEADPKRKDVDAIIRAALTRVFAPLDRACKRSTFNFPASRERVVRILEEAGFVPSMEQVWMIKTM